MKPKTPSPAVLRSCTEAARAAAAHAQESANWADRALEFNRDAEGAAESAHRSAVMAKTYAEQAAQTVRRLKNEVILTAFAAAIALTVSVFALYHAG